MEKKYEVPRIFDDAYVVVSTTKPIMGVKYNNEEDNYKIVYMTQDQILKKDNKNIFFEEYLGGTATKYKIKELLDNTLTVYNFLEELLVKQRIVKANKKKFPPKLIDSMEKYSKNLPAKDIYLESMPICSYSPLMKLKKTVEYEIKVEAEFRIEMMTLNEKNKFSIENLFEDKRCFEREVLINETFSSRIQRNTYDEIQPISIEY